jgi:phosphoserine phosphatase
LSIDTLFGVVADHRLSGSQMKKLVIFDLDGTLAQSKSSLEAMAGLLGRLLGIVEVAIISGGAWAQCILRYARLGQGIAPYAE